MPLPPKTTPGSWVGSRKQQIVETVLELVAAHGIESVSAQRVADAIGLSQPSVFRHFSTKEALWLAVMDSLGQRLIAIQPVTDEEVDEPGLVVLSRFFSRTCEVHRTVSGPV
jgi:AcrR family transcriptional regulator